MRATCHSHLTILDFDIPNNIWRRVQTNKEFLNQLSKYKLPKIDCAAWTYYYLAEEVGSSGARLNQELCSAGLPSNLGWDIACPDWGLHETLEANVGVSHYSYASSSFQILSNSLFANHPTIRPSVVWDTDGVIK
jgi:hypothetical protein